MRTPVSKQEDKLLSSPCPLSNEFPVQIETETFYSLTLFQSSLGLVRWLISWRKRHQWLQDKAHQDNN